VQTRDPPFDRLRVTLCRGFVIPSLLRDEPWIPDLRRGISRRIASGMTIQNEGNCPKAAVFGPTIREISEFFAPRQDA
jgi:hypothetical protein